MSARGIAHVPGLDGLRGLAVIGVLLFHAKGLLRGGYLGVDLFFVLSGYLITSILVREREATGRIDLRAFWVRRARRLLPAVLALMPAIALYAVTWARSSELGSVRADALATLGYVANWRAILAHRSYWQMFEAPSPLEHTWSLSIEEQFYVVWPVVVSVLVAWGGRRAVLAASLLLAAASALAMTLLYDGGNTTRVYLGTDTRGAAILVGAALATAGLGRRPAGGWLDGLGLGALVGLGWAWATLDGQDPLLYRGGFWATELLSLVLIACSVHRPGGIVARILTLAPLRAMGAISYGVYLWHWPVFVVLDEERVHLHGLALLAVRVGVTLAISIPSYRFLERPIRERGISWGRPLVVVPTAMAFTVAVVLVSTRALARPRALAATRPGAARVVVPGVQPVRWFPPSTVFPPELPPGTRRILVLGDSVGLSLGNRMYWSEDPGTYVVQRAVGDCSILDGILPVHSLNGEVHGNGDCSSSWARDVAELRPDATVVLLGGAFFSTVKIEGRWRSVCEPEWHDAFVSRLRDRLAALAEHGGKRVLLLAPSPVGKWENAALPAKVACYDRILRDAASDVDVVDLAGHVCPEGRCEITSRGEPVRPDGLHFDGLGAEDTARWVLGEVLGRVKPSL